MKNLEKNKGLKAKENENLEDISGGVNLKSKIASGVLAPVIALSGTGASAVNKENSTFSQTSSETKNQAQDSGKNKIKKSSTELKEKFVDFKNKNPKLVKGLGIGAGVAGAAVLGAAGIGATVGIGKIIKKIGLNIYLKDVRTAVDKMSKDELNTFLEEQTTQLQKN